MGTKENNGIERVKDNEEHTGSRLDKVTDALIDKLERAIEELDSYVRCVTVKEKSIEYDAEGKKAVLERVTEHEELHTEKGIVDRAALKQLSAVIKDLKGKEEEILESDGIVVVLSDDTKELAL